MNGRAWARHSSRMGPVRFFVMETPLRYQFIHNHRQQFRLDLLCALARSVGERIPQLAKQTDLDP